MNRIAQMGNVVGGRNRSPEPGRLGTRLPSHAQHACADVHAVTILLRVPDCDPFGMPTARHGWETR